MKQLIKNPITYPLIVLFIIILLASSCTTFRHELKSSINKDESYLINKYGKPDSILIKQNKIFVFIDNTKLGTFNHKIIQKRYFLIKNNKVTRVHFIQWGEDFNDRRIININ